MNILFIATRAPYGKMHGHKMGMRTYIRALQGLGHRVTVAAFAVPGDIVECEDLDAKTYYLPLPAKRQVVANLLRQGLSGRLSMNECLYASPEVQPLIDTIVRDHGIEFVVADMIRTAAYAERSRRPWMLDHEDLLSERYAMWARNSTGNENILGYLTDAVPAVARPAARALFRTLLTRESRTLDRRELFWTHRTLASSLRSMEETERLRERTARRVFCMPVSVPVPAEPARALHQRPTTAIFTGGLTYQPNLDALRAYAKDVLPAFEQQGVAPPVLQVIGAAPDALRTGLDHPSIRFLGYVPDVNEELRQAQVFFAPIVSGTGIKTKVLEAMAGGLPLIALPAGLTGLAGTAGRHYLRASDAADFVVQYQRIDRDPAFAEALGQAGRQLAIDNYSIEAATRILGAELAAMVAKVTPAGPERSIGTQIKAETAAQAERMPSH